MTRESQPRRSKSARCLARVTLAMLTVACVVIASPSAFAQSDPGRQLFFPTPNVPASGIAARLSTPDRVKAIVAFEACGQDIDFLHRVRSTDVHDQSTGDALGLVLAKMFWFAGLPRPDGTPLLSTQTATCTQVLRMAQNPVDTLGLAHGANDNSTLSDAFVAAFGSECRNGISVIAEADNTFTVTISDTPLCLRAQINKMLSQTQVTGQMGTDEGMPCGIFKTLHSGQANWDFSVRVLVRLVYLDMRYRLTRLRFVPGSSSILDDPVRTHIRQDLINTDIWLGPADYSLTGCGNEENATGSAADRVDDSDFFKEVGDDLEDIFDWLIKHFYLAYPAASLLGAGPSIAALITEAVGVVDLVSNIRIDETENHRLMIESSRYLNNQLLNVDLQGDDDRRGVLADAQSEVRDWLLQRLQDILKNDFIEYNARPYQRESISAILNLYDFAGDSNMRAAARFVLEYAFAKFAVGSNQGRRLVPFRRHMGDLATVIEQVSDPSSELTNTGREADHQVSLGLLYTGQTQQLANGAMANSIAGEAIFAATSSFRPDDLVLDIAVDRSVPYDQAIRHGGYEVYSSGPGYLITAGGVITDYAYSRFGVGSADDRGAGVPTTIMFSGGVGHIHVTDLIRFNGLRYRVKGVLGDAQESDDNNLCVTHGFACGVNLRIPPDIAACSTPGPASRESYWSFVDLTACAGYQPQPQLYLVIYQRPCLAAAEYCDNFGFVEVAPAQGTTFAAFMADTLNRNPASLIASPSPIRAGGAGSISPQPLPSTYVAADGRRIEFDVMAYANDDDRFGIERVNGDHQPDLADWDLARGDVLQKKDEPLVTIRHPKSGKTIVLDLRNTGSPVRTPP